MMQMLSSAQANASSPHRAGAEAAAAIAQARASVGRLIGADPAEIIFTSGATEANNIAILGVAKAASRQESKRRRIVVSAIEHKAVLAPARILANDGFEIVECPVKRDGQVDLVALERLVTHETLLVSVMAANNEIGVVQPLAAVATIVRGAGAFLHSDAAQAVGKIPIDVFSLDIDYLSVSAHKIYGPQGVGALFISAGALRPEPLVHGGGQEGGLRAGTLPVGLIGAFGAAAECAITSMVADTAHGHRLTELFLAELEARQVPHATLCAMSERLPGSVGLRFVGVDADALTRILSQNVSVTSGSACNSGQIEPSHVLLAIGQSPSESSEFVRIFFSRYNNETQAQAAAAYFAEACVKVRLATGEVHQ